MNIPKSFALGGIKINIEYKDILAENYDCMGQAVYSQNTLELSNRLKGEYKEYVFCHELVHHILNAMNEHELNSSEKFVHLFATFLHQSIKTGEEI